MLESLPEPTRFPKKSPTFAAVDDTALTTVSTALVGVEAAGGDVVEVVGVLCAGAGAVVCASLPPVEGDALELAGGVVGVTEVVVVPPVFGGKVVTGVVLWTVPLPGAGDADGLVLPPVVGEVTV